jgi:hypothetical protein
MHARDSQSQEASYNDSSPDEIYPVATPMEEKTEGYQASSNSDGSSTKHMGPTKY